MLMHYFPKAFQTIAVTIICCKNMQTCSYSFVGCRWPGCVCVCLCVLLVYLFAIGVCACGLVVVSNSS